MSQAGAANDGGVSPGLIVETLTGNSGGAVGPTANNINDVGTGSITVVGTPGTSTLTTQLTGLTNHNVLVGAGTATITKVAPSATAGVPLVSAGAAADPAFGTAVVAGGGTGATSLTAYAVLTGGTTSTNPVQSIASVGTAGQVLTSNGAAALPSFQAVPSSQFQLAILGYYGSTASNVTGDGTVYNMIFDGASLNRGGYYNTATGGVTIPTTGLYQLSGTITLTGIDVTTTTLHLRFDDGAGDTWESAFLNPSLLAGAAAPNWYAFPFSIPCTPALTVHKLQLIVSGGAKQVDVISSGASTYFGMFGPV